MAANPEVSVVMSVRAQDPSDRMLERAISSILEQTYTDFEFVIVNDASSTAVARMLDARAKTDSRIVLKSNPVNLGLSRSLAETIPGVRGRLVARQDADDYSEPDRIQKQVERFSSDLDLVLLGAWTRHRDESGKAHEQKYQDSHQALSTALYYTNPFCHASVMFRKDAYLRAGGYNPELSTSQDLDLWVKLQREGKIGMVEEYLVERTIHGNSISRKKAWKQVGNSLRIRLEGLASRPSLRGLGATVAGTGYHALMTLLDQTKTKK